MHRHVLSTLLFGSTLLGISLLGAGPASAQTAVERAQRQLDQQVQQDRFLDAARDARGDARPGSAARADDLDADRAPLMTNRGLQENSVTRPGNSPVTPIPSIGDNVQR